jgi:3-oxoacyl-[acyl-carrier-protein] synthase II
LPAFPVLFPSKTRRSETPRVVVTGVGVVSALGLGWEANEEGFRMGRTAFGPVRGFDASRQRTRIAAEVDLPSELPPTRLGRRQATRLDRAARMLLWAAAEAWEQAAWERGLQDLPVVLGTTSGGMALGEEYFRRSKGVPPGRRRLASLALHYQPQRQVLDLMEAFQFRGPSRVIANACASGGNAIGEAFEWIRSGRAERVLTGGYDAVTQLVFAGFDSLQALSTTRCLPFDARRNGLGLGEGAAVLCLESLESAQARKAGILGEIVGYGASTDVHHLTQPNPTGEAALDAMTLACSQAGIIPSQIDYINAHGTGTLLNDAAETQAIHSWAGDAVGRIPVSSTKAGIGHLLGAAGAVEAVVCFMALRGQWLPPEPSDLQVDPLCRFPVVTQPTPARLVYVLSNSFGFGGANASLVFRQSP